MRAFDWMWIAGVVGLMVAGTEGWAQTLEEALNLPTGIVLRSPTPAPAVSPWIVDSSVSYGGTTQAPLSAKSGPIGDSAKSWFEIDVAGPGTVSFYYMVSCSGGDGLSFSIKAAGQTDFDEQLSEYSKPWTQAVYNLEPGMNTLRWTFSKDKSGTKGADAAWVDMIEVSKSPEATIVEALNLPSDTILRVPQVAADVRPWFVTDRAYYREIPQEPAISARSPYLRDNQISWFEIEAEGPRSISFYYAVDSGGRDELSFGIKASGQTTFDTQFFAYSAPWSKATYSLEPGINVLRWTFSKDKSGEKGSDAAWVDCISLSDLNNWTPNDALNLPRAFEIRGPAIAPDLRPWFVTDQNYIKNEAQAPAICLRSPYLGNNQMSWFETDIIGPGTISFYYRAIADSSDYLTFAIKAPGQQDFVRQLSAYRTDWTQATYSLVEGRNTVRWSFFKDNSGSHDEDAAFVDFIQTTGKPIGTMAQSPLRPILGVEVPSELLGDGGVNFVYEWTSSGNDKPIVHGPKTEMKDLLVPGEGGCTIDLGETWAVTVKAFNAGNQEVAQTRLQFLISDEASMVPHR